MFAKKAKDDRRPPPNYAQLKACRMWLRAKMVLEDETLLPELGFPTRGDVEKVVMLVTASDRLSNEGL
jgi:hypothetical protein